MNQTHETVKDAILMERVLRHYVVRRVIRKNNRRAGANCDRQESRQLPGLKASNAKSRDHACTYMCVCVLFAEISKSPTSRLHAASAAAAAALDSRATSCTHGR